MTLKTSLEMAREYEARLEYYLSHSKSLPLRAGKVNATAVATACGFDRQILYKNKKCRAMLEGAAAEKGLTFIQDINSGADDLNVQEAMVPAVKLRKEQQRVGALERRLSEMTARNASLCTRLRQHEAIEAELIISGRRSRPTAGAPLFDQEDND